MSKKRNLFPLRVLIELLYNSYSKNYLCKKLNNKELAYGLGQLVTQFGQLLTQFGQLVTQFTPVLDNYLRS